MHAHIDINKLPMTARVDDIEAEDRHRARRDLHLLAFADELVGALAVDLDRGHRRGHLHDLPGQLRHGLGDLGVGDTGSIGRGDDLPVGIFRGGGLAQANRRSIHLVVGDQMRQQLRAPAHAHYQHARGQRVQRARVAHLARAEEAAQPGDDVMASHALGLIDDDQSGIRQRVVLGFMLGMIHSFTVCRNLMVVDIWNGLDAVPDELAASVVTIGVFDGVHRGHQRLIGEAVDTAREAGLPSVLMTFDPHPVAVFAPERTPTMLTTLEERAELVAALGVDNLLVVDFTKELAGVSPEAYFRQVLVDTLHAHSVAVGENFTFGAGAEGTADTMCELGKRHGVKVEIVDLLVDDDHRVSSTYIRERLSAGDIPAANEALGRNYSVESEIERGAGRGGRELGYPTANQYFSESVALPADGVYAGWFTVLDDEPIDGDMLPGQRYPTAISIGTNPTFGDHRRSVESFILDQEADLYGRIAKVEFVEKVRDMVKFHSVEELLENMARDVTNTREVLGLQ